MTVDIFVGEIRYIYFFDIYFLPLDFDCSIFLWWQHFCGCRQIFSLLRRAFGGVAISYNLESVFSFHFLGEKMTFGK